MLSLFLRQGFKELKPAISMFQRRTFMQFLRAKPNEKKYRLKDKIDESFTIIYKAPMEYYLLSCNYVTSISALMISAFVVYKYVHRFEEVSSEERELDLANGMATIADSDVDYFAIALVCFAVMIRAVLYKYPLRIYKSKANYIAIFEGSVPLTKTKLSFQKGAVKELPPTGILPWKEHRYSINKRSVIMYLEYFRTPSELMSMMIPKKAK